MKKILCIFTSVVMVFALALAGGGKSYAAVQTELKQSMLLTFKDAVNGQKLYEEIKFLDSKGSNVQVLMNAISEKQVVVTPVYDMQNEKLTIETKYKNFTVTPYQGQAFIGTKENIKKIAEINSGNRVGVLLESQPAMAADGAANASAKNVQDFSNTNVQVAGIDEADIIKTDGSHIYYLKDGKVVIVKADRSNLTLESTINYAQGALYPQELYVEKDKLVVLGTAYNKNGSFAKAVIYDLTDKKQPKVIRTIEQEGSYVNSRKKGSELHIVSNYYMYPKEGDIIVPYYKDTLKSMEYNEISPAKTMIFPGYIANSMVIITSLDLNKSDESKVISFVGNADNMYMSPNSIYLAYQKMTFMPFLREIMPVTEPGLDLAVDSKMVVNPGIMPPYNPDPETTIKKFDVNGTAISYKAEAIIQGWVLNQFSMDEKDGYFRIAYTKDYNEYKNGSSLSVFDSNMKQVGSIDHIAPGEKIHSARFMGDKAYMVTFKNIDPFFVLDLKNPSAPKILGYLKIPGVSEYLHPYDENHIIGIGKDAIDTGKQAYYLGMKMSMFDVTDFNNPVEKDVVKIGDRGTESEVLYNHKALMYDGARSILGFPITVAQVKGSKELDAYGFPPYGEQVFQGAYLYNITKDKTFQQRGTITHFTNFNPYNYEYDNSITRLIYIGDTIYTVSNNDIVATDINSMRKLSSVSIK